MKLKWRAYKKTRGQIVTHAFESSGAPFVGCMLRSLCGKVDWDFCGGRSFLNKCNDCKMKAAAIKAKKTLLARTPGIEKEI